MSFDPRSLQRLRDLGRQLPQPLPEPQSTEQLSPRPGTKHSQDNAKRHRIETEKNPEALFHELMQVSPDGTVPEHLIERLRNAEANSKPQASEIRHQTMKLNNSQGANQPLRTDAPASGSNRSVSAKGKIKRSNRPKTKPGSEEEQLYVDFGQLLLEED